LGPKKKKFFSQALATKSLWRLLFNKGLWRKLMRWKYIKEGTIEEYLRLDRTYIKRASLV